MQRVGDARRGWFDRPGPADRQQQGLHARASAKFVQTSERFNAEVKVSRCGETVGGLSIMGLMMLAAARGTTITVEVRGQEAAACMAAIEALVADKFGEEA